MMHILKIRSDVSCLVLKEGDKIAEMEADKFYKMNLQKGSHLLKFISKANVTDFFEQIYTVNETDSEGLLFINLKPIIKYREQAENKAADEQKQQLEFKKRETDRIERERKAQILMQEQLRKAEINRQELLRKENEERQRLDKLWGNLKNDKFLEMSFVKGESFQMGSIYGEEWEKPIHTVTLSDYYICKYTVTEKLWFSVMGKKVSRSMGENYPITSVNWIECIKFCNLLSKIAGLKEYYNIKYDLLDDYTSCIVKYHFDDAEILSNSKGFRLPTEAEFEYAARGGNKSKNYLYSGSNEIDKVAWYKNNSNGELQLVGQKQPNELGLHDMSGNVNQWCYDWFEDYNSYSRTNPIGRSKPNFGHGLAFRIYRGGDYISKSTDCKVSRRGFTSPDGLHLNGFRLVRNA
jgi:sulfatase modifying factor 1